MLLFITQRKIGQVRQGVSTYNAGAGITVVAEEPPIDGRQSQSSTAGLYQDPGYYRNYIANMHPTAIRAPSHEDERVGRFDALREQTSYQSLRDPSPSPTRGLGAGPNGSSGSIGYYDAPNLGVTGSGSILNRNQSQSRHRSTPDLAPAPASPALHPQINEDEQVSQHLARLLLNTRDGGGPGGANASQTTFRIDWRSEDDDDPNSPRGAGSGGGIQMRTRTGSGSRLVPPGKLAGTQNVAGVPALAPPLARLAPYRGGDGSTSRGGDVVGGGHGRRKSRDDRRREIELGFVGQQPPPGSRDG